MEIKEKIKNLPTGPGVYIMKSQRGKIIYVGKASSMRKRVKSHFSSRVSLRRDIFLEQVTDIDCIECETEEQALILEAALIKEQRPKYNIALRDNKSYPYIEITREKFPRVFISRPKQKTANRLFGPYPKTKLLKSALGMIRKIFGYCSCRGNPKEPCLFFHLHLCPAPCAGKVSFSQYRDNIENICKILKGERRKLESTLRRKMEKFAQEAKFEEAAAIRDKLLAIENLYRGKPRDHQIISLKEILHLPHLPLTIEAIDISSLAGSSATGAVVVFKDAAPDRNNYRRYRIKEVKKIDDYAMIGEVTRRRYGRLLREGKKLPDLVIIDGGRGHVQRAKEELATLKAKIPIIGIAKKNEEIWFPFAVKPLVIPPNSPCLHLIQYIRDEAHRFAHAYHSVRRRRKMIENK
ncbi:MAG: excinuclease ABC subunit UvrC [Candidatus Omnitrophota bacterium]|nr:MAG: excinuclease ABC subunit UvrC [Candidatus Omnitrophota bacterium]